MKISDESLVDRFVEAKTVMAVMDKAAKAVEGPLKNEFFDWFTEQLWTNKAIPENPRVTTTTENGENNSILFQMRNTFRPERNLPPPKNRDPSRSTRSYLEEILQSLGFDPKRAGKIIDDNIRFTHTFSLKYSVPPYLVEKFWGVMFATSKTKMVAGGVFTDEEREDLFDSQEIVLLVEPDQLFRRLLGLCGSLEELRSLTKFFCPEVVISNIKFALSAKLGDTPKLDAANRIIGEA